MKRISFLAWEMNLILTFRKDNSSSSLLSEGGSIRLESSLSLSHGSTSSLMIVVTSFGLVVTIKVSNTWFRGGSKAESTASRRNSSGMLRLVLFLFGWFVLLSGDEVVDAFLEFHLFIYLFLIIVC